MTRNRRPPAVSKSSFRVARFSLFLGLILPVIVRPAGLRAAGDQLDPHKPYALIFGTVWGPDDRPVYGVRVRIRRADQKRAKWELYSDHSGEFAQRLPAGQADYVVWADTKDLKSLNGKKLDPGPEVTVHIQSDERADIGLHLK
ncbi:MAG: carboxypeptidase-like regulatory domain-containing protein [Terriglobales bacterium]